MLRFTRLKLALVGNITEAIALDIEVTLFPRLSLTSLGRWTKPAAVIFDLGSIRSLSGKKLNKLLKSMGFSPIQYSMCMNCSAQAQSGTIFSETV